eukprot:4116818-Pleurochrysis_carterae.AAC.2
MRDSQHLCKRRRRLRPVDKGAAMAEARLLTSSVPSGRLDRPSSGRALRPPRSRCASPAREQRQSSAAKRGRAGVRAGG